MDAGAVADYLKENPAFFEQYADLLAEIFVPHPHGGRAIPIAERQIVTLREKNAQLETKLEELIQFGSENDAISEKLHRSTLALFAARTSKRRSACSITACRRFPRAADWRFGCGVGP
jgi:uncharacterized protein YigA (DUF484 family)